MTSRGILSCLVTAFLDERTRSNTTYDRDASTPENLLCDRQSESTGFVTDTITTQGHPAFDAQELRGGHPSCDPSGLWVHQHVPQQQSPCYQSTLTIRLLPPAFRRTEGGVHCKDRHVNRGALSSRPIRMLLLYLSCMETLAECDVQLRRVTLTAECLAQKR